MFKLLYLIVIAYAIAPPFLTSGPFDETAQTFWFDQRLDHSDPASTTKWQQRYHLYDDHFVDGESKAVIIYICGEWTCNGIGGGSFSFVLAQQFKAKVLVLEHRFYGKSQPFGPDSWSAESLKYLSVHQALDDLAYFIMEVKRQGLHNIDSTFPWIAVGGSYPGALSAWFRYKYPHLTVGNLASSAVINTILDFHQFDEQIRASALRSGWECPYYIALMNSYIDSLLNDPKRRDSFKKSFRADQMSDNEFRWLFTDTVALQIQGGGRTKLCESFNDKTIADMVEIIRQITLLSDDYKQYGSYYLSNPIVDYQSNYRQWYYQCCSEVAYLQTAPRTKDSLRSQQLDLEFFKQWCKDSYQVDETIIFPSTDVTESYWGGLKLNVDHLIMTNGIEDPWQQASLTNNANNQKVQTILIDCPNCAHCVDLKTPTDNDADTLKQARLYIQDKFQQWIDEFWNSQ